MMTTEKAKPRKPRTRKTQPKKAPKSVKETCKNIPTKRLEALAECGGYNADTGTEYHPEAIHLELMRRYEEKSERELMDRIAALEAIDWEPMYDEENAPTLEVRVDFETFMDSFQLCVVDAEALPFLARLKAIRGAMKSLFPAMDAGQREEWTGKLYASLLSNSAPLAG
jgi:hypothetical protein